MVQFVARISAKFGKSTGYNLITIVGICMQIFPMQYESILIFQDPLNKIQKHSKSKMREYKKAVRKMLPVSEAVTDVEKKTIKIIK